MASGRCDISPPQAGNPTLPGDTEAAPFLGLPTVVRGSSYLVSPPSNDCRLIPGGTRTGRGEWQRRGVKPAMKSTQGPRTAVRHGAGMSPGCSGMLQVHLRRRRDTLRARYWPFCVRGAHVRHAATRASRCRFPTAYTGLWGIAGESDNASWHRCSRRGIRCRGSLWARRVFEIRVRANRPAPARRESGSTCL